MSDVDYFVSNKVLPEFQPVVALIRQHMQALAPEAKELMSYGIPAYRGRRMLAVISPTKKDITLAFSRGAEMEDQYGLLRGVGKKSKHLKFKVVEEVDHETLAYYVEQALELDRK